MQCTIREALVSDRTALAGLMEQLGYPITPNDMSDQIALYRNSKDTKTWVAECNGFVIGCVATVIIEYFHRKARFMRIITLVVDTQYRRQGIGKLLMEYAELYAQKEGCDFIELTSGAYRAKLGSHDFYKALGYQDLCEIKKYMAKKIR